jgi:hypothetical protein
MSQMNPVQGPVVDIFGNEISGSVKGEGFRY